MRTACFFFAVFAVGCGSADSLPPAEEKFVSDRIAKLINSDGTLQVVVDLVKSEIDNPDTFEHVLSRYWDNDDHIKIWMRFGSKSAKGTFLHSEILVETTLDGEEVREWDWFPDLAPDRYNLP